jgi:hypothetical protein
LKSLTRLVIMKVEINHLFTKLIKSSNREEQAKELQIKVKSQVFMERKAWRRRKRHNTTSIMMLYLEMSKLKRTKKKQIIVQKVYLRVEMTQMAI